MKRLFTVSSLIPALAAGSECPAPGQKSPREGTCVPGGLSDHPRKTGISETALLSIAAGGQIPTDIRRLKGQARIRHARTPEVGSRPLYESPTIHSKRGAGTSNDSAFSVKLTTAPGNPDFQNGDNSLATVDPFVDLPG